MKKREDQVQISGHTIIKGTLTLPKSAESHAPLRSSTSSTG